MRKVLFTLISVLVFTIGIGLDANARPSKPSGHGGHNRVSQHKAYRHHGPMNASTFDKLCADIKKADWYDKQYDLISKSLAHGEVFSVAQTVYLMKMFGNYVSKEKIALMIYPTVYDRENWYQVYDVMYDHYWKRDLQNKIADIDRRKSK